MPDRRPTARRRALRLAAIFVGGLVVAVALLAASSYLPSGPIEAHVARDVDAMAAEGLWPLMQGPFDIYMADNFTDAWMLNTALIDRDGNPAINTLQSTSYRDGDPIESLQVRLDRDAETNTEYWRYWHGYLVALRPLLLFAGYAGIQRINEVALSMMALIVAAGLWRKAGWGAAIGFAFSMVLIGMPDLARTLQFSSVLYVAFAGMIAVLVLSGRSDARRWDLELFAVLGIATAYIDLLTAPVVTLGLPLLALQACELARSGKTRWQSIARSSVAWGASYATFWVAKWALAYAVGFDELFEPVSGALNERFGTGLGMMDRVGAAVLNAGQLLPNWVMTVYASEPFAALGTVSSILGVFAVVWLAGVVITRTPVARSAAAAPVLAVAMVPYLWYAFAADHSIVHVWYTYRAQAVTVFALAVFLAFSVEWRRRARRSSR